MVGRISAVLLFGLVLLFAGCNNQDSDTSTLMLSVQSKGDSLSVAGYKVLDRPYQKSYQQGRYQIHLMNTKGTIIQKISFDKLSFGDTGSSGRMQLIVPMKPEFQELALYKLDGSSGHYQLKDTQPLLSWQLPGELREKTEAK